MSTRRGAHRTRGPVTSGPREWASTCQRKERVDPSQQKRHAMSAVRADRRAQPDDPEELRSFFSRRAQERDRAGRAEDSSRKAEGAAKTPKETRDSAEPKVKPTKPDRGPGAKAKKKPKPYKVIYLTLEESRALKDKAEDDAPGNQTTAEDRTNVRSTGKQPDTEDRAGTTEARESATAMHGAEEPKASMPNEPDNQPEQPVQTRPRGPCGPIQTEPTQTAGAQVVGHEQGPTRALGKPKPDMPETQPGVLPRSRRTRRTRPGSQRLWIRQPTPAGLRGRRDENRRIRNRISRMAPKSSGQVPDTGRSQDRTSRSQRHHPRDTGSRSPRNRRCHARVT